MNLFFYLQTFILNYSFIVILSDHIFCTFFIKTQPYVKQKPVKTEKKLPERSRSILGRFYCIDIFHYDQSHMHFVLFIYSPINIRQYLTKNL